MTQYNTLNVKLSNSKLNKLKSAIKKGTDVTLNLSSNLVASANDETNFPHKSLLTNTQVSKIRKAFANVSSANIKFSKTHLSRIIQLGGFGGISGVTKPLIKRLDSLPKFIDNELNNVLNNKDKVFDSIKGIKRIKRLFWARITLRITLQLSL